MRTRNRSVHSNYAVGRKWKRDEITESRLYFDLLRLVAYLRMTQCLCRDQSCIDEVAGKDSGICLVV